MRFATRPLARAVTLSVTLGLAAVSLSSVAPTATSAVVLTKYGYLNSAAGSEVIGGSIPASSGSTASTGTPCTRKAGIFRSNEVAGVNVNKQVRLNGVKSFSRTFKDRNGGHHSWAQNTIAKVILGDGAAVIRALETTSDSWVDKNGKYHATSRITGSIKVGPAPAMALPDPGSRPIVIPGVGSLTIGHNYSKIQQGVQAYNGRIAVLLKLDPSKSTVKIGRARSKILAQMQEGVMGGHAYGSTVNALNGTVTSGKTALRGLPCQGTGGEWMKSNTAGVHLPGAEVGVTVSEVFGKRGAGVASAVTRSKVASVDLGDGQLQITGIFSQARVDKAASGKITPKASFGILHITGPDGETHDLIPGRTLEIPGLAKITAGVVTKGKNSIRVHAVVIELFGTSPGASIIKLGNSSAALAPNA